MDPEISPEEEVGKTENARAPRRFRWRGALLVLLLVLATGLVFAGGYFAVVLWQYYFPSSFLNGPDPYANWQVYRSETYELGLRYPDDWEAEEAKPAFVVFHLKPATEETVLPKDYISLAVADSSKRDETACEKDQSKCSFYANGIYGDRITTPESESILFSQGENDFTLTWSKYGEADYSTIFEEMGKSLRFITTEDTDAQNP